MNSPIPFVQTASYPVRTGNRVRPLIDGEPAFRRVCAAIEAAQHSVWVTVTFMWSTFQMPDGQGSALDVLDRAAARGVDVRVIFWRPEEGSPWREKNAFWGSPAQLALLEDRRSGIAIRWDRNPGFCQHQKSWLIDAGFAGETSFVGGINLNPHSVVSPGHAEKPGLVGQNHDIYVELTGPSVVDVHHNFVQRWNEASERSLPDGCFGLGALGDLAFPGVVPAAVGDSVVQIQRTMPAGRYSDGRAAPGGQAFDIAGGERSNFDQYCLAIDAARRTIYIENHSLDVPEIVDGLRRALERGVDVILVMPCAADVGLPIDLSFPYPALAPLRVYENFLLAGLAGPGLDGTRQAVYVHSKVMLVDDEWATVGSCNLHRFSLSGNGEMNVAFYDPAAVRAFRCELFSEHLGMDTSGSDDRAAFGLFRRVAGANRERLDAGGLSWQGLALNLIL